MHILVCNDDGIDAPGIHALAEELKSIAKVTVIAPDRQQSAVGHAITMQHPLRVVEWKKDGRFFGYAVKGTPADAVKLADKLIETCNLFGYGEIGEEVHEDVDQVLVIVDGTGEAILDSEHVAIERGEPPLCVEGQVDERHLTTASRGPSPLPLPPAP